jgi:hypothetical protein
MLYATDVKWTHLLLTKKIPSVFMSPKSIFLTLIVTFLNLSSEILAQSFMEATNHELISWRPHCTSYTSITTTEAVIQRAEKMSLNKLTTKYYWLSCNSYSKSYKGSNVKIACKQAHWGWWRHLWKFVMRYVRRRRARVLSIADHQ